MNLNNSIGAVSQSHNVFVYGTLLSDEVVKVLLNRLPPSSPAILPAHRRFSIKDRVYPAIMPMENHKVTGKVLMDISGQELDLLDEYEDVEYERRDVEVLLMDNSEKLHACTYIWSDKSDPNLLYGDWDFEEWKRVQMNDFLKMIDGFLKELENSDSKSRVEAYKSFYNHDDDKSTEL